MISKIEALYIVKCYLPCSYFGPIRRLSESKSLVITANAKFVASYLRIWFDLIWFYQLSWSRPALWELNSNPLYCIIFFLIWLFKLNLLIRWSLFTVIVKATNGPRYVVGCRRQLDKAKLKSGTRVALDMTTLTIMRLVEFFNIYLYFLV